MKLHFPRRFIPEPVTGKIRFLFIQFVRVLDRVANSFFFSAWNCSSVSKIQLHAHIVNLREYPLGVNFAHSFSKVAYYVH